MLRRLSVCALVLGACNSIHPSGGDIPDAALGPPSDARVPIRHGGRTRGALRETDVVYVGGERADLKPFALSAAGSGAEAVLTAWRVGDGDTPEELESSRPFDGHDVRLHALTPDENPYGNYAMVISGAIDGVELRLRTWRVNADGTVDELDSQSYGGADVQVQDYDIAHRPGYRNGDLDRFLVVTPVQAHNANHLRMVSWRVNPTTGAISLRDEELEGTTPDVRSGLSINRLTGGVGLSEYFGIVFRTSSDELRQRFWEVRFNGDLVWRGNGASSYNFRGTDTLAEPILFADAAPFTDHGFLAAIERPGEDLELITYENRFTISESGGIVEPYYISDNTLDQTPGTNGVVVMDPFHASQKTMVVDVASDSVLYRTCSTERQGIASVTKVMTALIALDAVAAGSFDLHEVNVPISANAADVGGSQMDMLEGETHSLSTLLRGLIAVSGNDAALAIAEHISGSEAAFVSEMQAMADSLGLSASTYCQPAGGCFSTAEDQVRLWSALVDRADFQEFLSEAEAVHACGLDPFGVEKCYILTHSTNALTGIDSWKAGNGGFFCGGELNELPLCETCLSAQATRLDRTLALSQLQPQPLAAQRWPDARALFTHGFRRLFTADDRGQGKAIRASDFGLDVISARQALSASVDPSGQVVLCGWSVDAQSRDVREPRCATLANPGLMGGGTVYRLENVEIVRLADGDANDFVVAQLDDTELELSLWRVAPNRVEDYAEGACCGDGIRQAGEECDVEDFGETTCASEGFAGGSLSCDGFCRIQTDECNPLPTDEPPASYGACHANAETCNHDPAQCNGDGQCLGGPCRRTDPGANPLDPNSAYHPDGNFRDAEGNLYYCEDNTGIGEMVCVDENGWGVCRRCADEGELTSRLGCKCNGDDQCAGNEPDLSCYGHASGGGPGQCYPSIEGPPYWQCQEAFCGMAPYFSTPEDSDVMYCHHYFGNTASNAHCEPFLACNSILADVCSLAGGICAPDAGICTDDDCCADTCTHNDDCSQALGWPSGYVCGGGECVPD